MFEKVARCAEKNQPPRALLSLATGTGKTLAFAIPVIQRTVAPHDADYDQLAAPGKPQALVVAPTRELALQVAVA